MAHTTTNSRVPQHVTALLSHLTSRPGVQSTFILSRKDGSIIQSTGLLASKPAETSPNSTAAQMTPTTEEPPLSTPITSPINPADLPLPSSPTSSTPYQPTPAEALAARVFAFVSSASDLSVSLSRPLNENNQPSKPETNGILGNGVSKEDGEAEGSDKGDDDEVKLLRLRTKRHEIVVVPDKKYLLCVVHGAANAAGGTGSAGIRSSR